MKNCCICCAKVDEDNAAVLGMGGGGNPRLLCPNCEKLLDDATTSTDYETARLALRELTDILGNNDPDPVTMAVMTDILLRSTDRAKAIKEGTSDFSLDQIDESGFDEIPEELQETEEDKELDRIEEEKMKKFDKVFNVIAIILGAGCLGLVIWKFVDSILPQIIKSLS